MKISCIFVFKGEKACEGKYGGRLQAAFGIKTKVGSNEEKINRERESHGEIQLSMLGVIACI